MMNRTENRKKRKEIRNFLSQHYGCWDELSTQGQYNLVTRTVKSLDNEIKCSYCNGSTSFTAAFNSHSCKKCGRTYYTDDGDFIKDGKLYHRD